MPLSVKQGDTAPGGAWMWAPGQPCCGRKEVRLLLPQGRVATCLGTGVLCSLFSLTQGQSVVLVGHLRVMV